MRVKDQTVECMFHPMISALLLQKIDPKYKEWGSECVVTSGSEPHTRHSRTSLHYSDPCCAVDIRIWEVAQVPTPTKQAQAINEIKNEFCEDYDIPTDWFDIVLESDHIHIEFQPKVQEHFFQDIDTP